MALPELPASTPPVVLPASAEPAAVPPGPVFDEAEVARLTAAAAANAAADATRAARQQLAAREVAVLEQLAAELLLAREAQREGDQVARRQLAQIATTIARTLLARGGDDPEHALAVVTAMLDGLPAIAGARLLVDSSMAAALERRLPELVRQAGFPIALEIDRDPDCAPGSARLVWDGGWVAHDPAEIGRQIAELLAAHAAPQSAAESQGE